MRYNLFLLSNTLLYKPLKLVFVTIGDFVLQRLCFFVYFELGDEGNFFPIGPVNDFD